MLRVVSHLITNQSPVRRLSGMRASGPAACAAPTTLYRQYLVTCDRRATTASNLSLQSLVLQFDNNGRHVVTPQTLRHHCRHIRSQSRRQADAPHARRRYKPGRGQSSCLCLCFPEAASRHASRRARHQGTDRQTDQATDKQTKTTYKATFPQSIAPHGDVGRGWREAERGPQTTVGARGASSIIRKGATRTVREEREQSGNQGGGTSFALGCGERQWSKRSERISLRSLPSFILPAMRSTPS